jgi:thioredoxin reductase (NADPH)
METEAIWDCIVVGAGPAGLSAAIYMGRFRRRTLVISDGDGRWSYGQRNENYLGFPEGVSARHLHELGVAQAERFDVAFSAACVTSVSHDGKDYSLETGMGLRAARTLIWATGVRDHWPAFPGVRRLVGTSLFWCIVCDGWRTRDKDVLIFGNADSVGSTVLQFLTYTRRLTVLVDPEKDKLSLDMQARLEAEGIAVRRGNVKRVHEVGSMLREVVLADGTVLEPDYLFSLLGSTPKTSLLRNLPVALDDRGHVIIDDKNRTSLATFFAAGDVSNKHSHQVVSAAHEGAMSAQAANHVLYFND